MSYSPQHRLVPLFTLAAALAFAALVGPSRASALEPGTKMPAFDVKDIAGKPVSAASLAGKVVVIDFWATWCGPCKEELPMLQKLYEKYRDKGFVVIAVSVDKELENVKKFLAKLPLTFPVVHDAGHQVTGRFQPPRMPSSYVVDKKGVVRHVHAGYRAEDAKTFESEVRALLAK